MSQVCGSFDCFLHYLMSSLHFLYSTPSRIVASPARFTLFLTSHYTSTSILKLLLTSRNSTSIPSSHSPFPRGKQKPLTPPQNPSPQNKSRKTTNPTIQPMTPHTPILLKAHLPRLNHRGVRPDPASEEQPVDHLASTRTQSEGAQEVRG
jgi:hypothetical protein